MMPRFRLVAGPNGSGKTTLMRRLVRDYAVNFYDTINADDIFAEASRTGAYAPKIPVDPISLADFAVESQYDADVKDAFASGKVFVDDGIVRFKRGGANSYTIALLAYFLQSEFISSKRSFSQETVFSHPSKLEALERAHAAGFRTYLYFVATDSPEVNAARVANRERLGGHAVPPEKITLRYPKSIGNASKALAYLSRAYFFDNSGLAMRYLGEWNAGAGFLPDPRDAALPRPAWLAKVLEGVPCGKGFSQNAAFAASAETASREAVASAMEKGLPVTIMKDGKIEVVPPCKTGGKSRKRRTRQAKETVI